jgi:hypothetical protein
MKEKIYTIPVTEAFKEDCECPMCKLESDAEAKYIEYFLGPSLMEPDHRIETNKKGFCAQHFKQLYNRQENRLGLSLMTGTHFSEQNKKLEKLYHTHAAEIKKDANIPILKKASNIIRSRKTSTEIFIDELIQYLEETQCTCAVCDKLRFTMDRYVDVILYLFFEEKDFRECFKSKKGFCIKHLKELLYGMHEYLSPERKAVILYDILNMQLENMDRLHHELDWFSKKFDYRNHDKPWGNSKDALSRTICKLTGISNLK